MFREVYLNSIINFYFNFGFLWIIIKGLKLGLISINMVRILLLLKDELVNLG